MATSSFFSNGPAPSEEQQPQSPGEVTTSFFYGGATPPEQNTVDALIDQLNEKVAAADEDRVAAELAKTQAETAAANAALSEANTAGLADQAQDTLTAANAASASASTAASNAASSASTATTKASEASASATAAASSATAAASSASSAASSASAVASSLTNYYTKTESDGRYPALSHTHSLSDITQSGATTGQVATWSGTAWVASSPGVSAGVASFNTRTGAVVLTSADVTSALAYTPVNRAGDTMTGKLVLPQVSSSAAPINIGQGGGNTAPNTPVNGDVWMNVSDLQYRQGNTTYTVPKLSDNSTWTGNNTFSGQSTFSGQLTASGTVNFSATTNNVTVGGNLTSGAWTAGGTTGTGAITLGRSTGNQTVAIHNGATASGSTKTLTLGTGGLAGSTTSITIGSSTGTTTVAANGTWTFSSAITGDISGNAGTVTNGVYTTGSYANPAWITSLAYSKLTGAPTALSSFTNDTNFITNAGNARTAVSNNGTAVGTRRTINFIPGTNVTLSVADDSVNEKVDVTINSTGGGGGGVTSFNTRTGAVTLASSDVTTALGYTPANRAGDTLTGKLNLAAVTAAASPINLGYAAGSTVPTTPANGDMWMNSGVGFQFRAFNTTYAVATNNGDQTFSGANTFSGALTASAAVTLSATTANIALGSSLTTGTWIAGGTTGTGAITLGRSTGSQTTNIQAGATASGSTKTLNIGTGGLAGSTTTIAIGSSTGTTTVAASGTWTFGSTISGSISGNAATVTDGVYTTGSYADPAWITSLSGAKLTGTVVATNGVVTTGSYADPAWITSLAYSKLTGAPTLPSGAIVGTTDTQTLSNKTLSGAILSGGYTESVFAVTDGASVALSPTNGSIQTWAIGANRTPTAGTWAAGQSMTLMIDDTANFTITWTSMPVTWVGGTVPTLATTGFTVIQLWKVGTTIYGAITGNVA
jgi:hypothetical protein